MGIIAALLPERQIAGEAPAVVQEVFVCGGADSAANGSTGGAAKEDRCRRASDAACRHPDRATHDAESRSHLRPAHDADGAGGSAGRSAHGSSGLFSDFAHDDALRVAVRTVH
ncbi:MAG TPA: hypothetical protein VIL30_22040 [Ramlibacter sp.]